jgi:hypothetical protein
MLYETLADAWPYCAGAALTCALAGPLYWECVAVGCGTAIIANLIEEALDVMDRCISSAATPERIHACVIPDLGGAS